MAKYPFSNKELRNAVRIYAERRNAALEECLDKDPVQFSPSFRQRIDELELASNAAIIRRRRRGKRIAIASLTLVLLLTAFFSFNTTARAGFINWIKDFYKEFIVYRIFGEEPSDSIPDLIPEWMPDELSLINKDSYDEGYTYLYENSDGSKGFILECAKAHSGSAIYISNDRDHFSLTIAGYTVDCYVSTDDASDYIWHDTDGKYFFAMNSDLPHETNVKIIENLKIVQ